MCHDIKIGYFVMFKLLTRASKIFNGSEIVKKPDVYRVTIYDLNGSEIVKKCEEHPINLQLKPRPVEN